MIIRPRLAPPPRLTAGVRGRIHWTLRTRAGIIVREGECSNLITDQGLDQIATYGVTDDLFAYMAVGTDNTAPTTSDTGLGSESARTNTTYESDAFTRVSDGYYRWVKHFMFDFNEANGNLTEFAVSYGSSAAANTFNRELFRDGSGDPEVVTKTSSYRLYVDYTFEVTLTPTTAQAASFTGTSIGDGTLAGHYLLLRGPTSGVTYTDGNDLMAFNAIATGAPKGAAGGVTGVGDPAWLWMATGSVSALAYDDQPPGANGVVDTDTKVAKTVQTATPSYSAGTFSRAGAVVKYETNRGIGTFYGIGLISSFSASFGRCQVGYLAAFDAGQEFAKDNLHELRVTLPTATWGRAS